MEIASHLKEYLEKTTVEVKNDIIYTTYYINRPIKQGDPQGGSMGCCKDGKDITTDIINYIYKSITL